MGDVNWLVVVTAAILIVAAMLGYINGLIKTILNLVIGVVTLILVLILSPRVCTFLQEQTGLPEFVNEKVTSVVWEQIEEQQTGQQEILLDQAGKEDFIDSLPFLPGLKETILENDQISQYANEGLEHFVDYVSDTVSDQIVVLIAYFATYVVVFLALRIVVFLLNILEHLPLIHGINKLTGLAAGLVEGLLLVWFLGIVLTMISTTSLGQSAAQCISESTFLSVIYGNNLLQQIVFWSIGSGA